MRFLKAFFKKLKVQKKAPPKKTETSVPQMSLAEIWAITDASDLVTALNTYIVTKCRYGKNMSALSAPERVFYVTQILEMEVNNGGFSQFFFNSSGDFANELIHAFTEIGAVKTAEICKRAVSVFGQEVPADRDERDDFLSSDEALGAILDECDNAFYAYEEDLNALTYGYVMRNRDAFR